MKKKVVTHNGGFHADDVFAVASLMLLYGTDGIEVVRSRDKDVIETGDIVLDVGMEYDPEKNRFDHHQNGGAGEHDNGIPYASFGLIWKHFGVEICGGDSEVARYVEEKLVFPIDAHDNGVSLYTKSDYGVTPFTMDDFVQTYYPSRNEGEQETDALFVTVVQIAYTLLQRLVEYAKQQTEDTYAIDDLYKNSEDPQILVLDIRRSWRKIVPSKYPEVQFVVYPSLKSNETTAWSIYGIQDKYPFSVDIRTPFPKEWSGKEGAELKKVSGVSEAIFCHRGQHMCVAETKEGALKMAELALKEK